MIKVLKILLCLISSLIVVVAETPALSIEFHEQKGVLLYVFMALVLMSVFFLQNQLFRYLIPKSMKVKFSYPGQDHYSKSFFRGTIGLGYFLVVIHLTTSHLDTVEGSINDYLYIGIILIFLGTLSKVKGIISNQLSAVELENS